MFSVLSKFAQTMSDYSSEFDTMYTTTDQTMTGADTAASLAGLGITMTILFVVFFVIAIPSLVVMWKLFTKAGRPGWAALVPIYNTYVLNDIAGTPIWYFLLTFVPTVGFIGTILIYMELAKKYSNATTVWLSLFIPIVSLFMIKNTEYIGGGMGQPQAAQGFGAQPQPQAPVAPQAQFTPGPEASPTAPPQAQQPTQSVDLQQSPMQGVSSEPQPTDSNQPQPPAPTV